jgi:hypothetical protein
LLVGGFVGGGVGDGVKQLTGVPAGGFAGSEKKII